MDRIAGPLIAIAVLLAAAMGIYVYFLQTDLNKANNALAAVTKNRDDFKTRLDEVNKRVTTSTTALDTCNTQLTETRTQLEASMKKTSAPAKR